MAEIIGEMMGRAGISASQFKEPADMHEYLQSRCDAFNQQKGNLTGYDCPVCHNKGYISKLDGLNEITVECVCMEARRSAWRMESSGLGELIKKCTFENYNASEPWQRVIFDGAKQYINDPVGKWFYIGGQPGAGKTHICTAIAANFLHRGESVRYMLWRDESVKIKASVNDAEYDSMVDPLKKVSVLYIDDFFKTGFDDKTKEKKLPTPADISLAYEILNFRYINPQAVTIISGEWFLDELTNIDEALGSRIYERAKESYFDIKRDHSRNYRMKKAAI